jgi:hypothetical protein
MVSALVDRRRHPEQVKQPLPGVGKLPLAALIIRDGNNIPPAGQNINAIAASKNMNNVWRRRSA